MTPTLRWVDRGGREGRKRREQEGRKGLISMGRQTMRCRGPATCQGLYPKSHTQDREVRGQVMLP